MEKIPEFLQEKLLKQYGQEITEQIINEYSEKRPVTLRVNTIRANKTRVIEELTKAHIIFKEVEWYQDALIIENVREEEIKKLEIYEKGEIYLQSLSSMLPPIILEPKADENILDMASAPGGKTTQMAALTGNGAMITACEKNKIRAESDIPLRTHYYGIKEGMPDFQEWSRLIDWNGRSIYYNNYDYRKQKDVFKLFPNTSLIDFWY